MNTLFLKILNMGISAGWLVLAVMGLRLLMKKTPKWVFCLLWCIVALRLLVPFSIESAWSLIPSPEVIPTDIAMSQTPAIHSAIPAVNSTINPLITTYFSEENRLDTVLFVAACVWLTGVAGMLLYSAVTWLKLHLRVRVSLLYRENIYICDEVDSPFLLGVFRPRIYIPTGMEEAQLEYVLAHEKTHIKRRDHWWKPLGFLLLSVYWFNPLLWAAYILLCRDIESACDEKVIAGMDSTGKIGYSEALAACSVHRRMVMACPVAFGEISVKARIKGVLNYKKPAFWVVCTSVVMCAVMAFCFLTNPMPCKHDYREQITLESTCTEKGMQTNTCDLCRHSYTVSVAQIAHTYDSGVITKQPDCTHRGSKVMSCVYCGDQQTEAVEMTDHIVGGPMTIHAPDCTHTGERIATCAHCHQDFVAEIYPTNDDHDLKEKVLKEATCAAPGEGVFTCSRCGYSESCSYQQLEHHYTKSVVKAATCIKNGIDRYACSGCGYSYQVETPFAEHNFVRSVQIEATYTTGGRDVYTCSGCRDFYVVETPRLEYD